MKGLYGYFALLIASLVFILSFAFKVMNLDRVGYSVFLRDFVLFVVVYNVAKYFFKYIEEIFNNYRKIL